MLYLAKKYSDNIFLYGKQWENLNHFVYKDLKDIALKLNDYVFEEQQKQKDSGGDVESHSRFADKFLDNNNVPGPEDGKLRGRLKAVSNSSSKKAPFINLAKSII